MRSMVAYSDRVGRDFERKMWKSCKTFEVIGEFLVGEGGVLIAVFITILISMVAAIYFW